MPLRLTHRRFIKTKLKYKDFPEFPVEGKRLLFVCVSGAHAYGTVKPDSDLDIRGVRIPDLNWATSLARNETGVEHRFGNVDVSIHNIYHFLSVLLHGNGTFLENMVEEQLYIEEPAFIELRSLVMKYGISKRFTRHYYGFINSAIKDYNKTKMVKKLLYGYRAGLSGTLLFRTGAIVCNLNELLDQLTDCKWTKNARSLLNVYRNEVDLIMPNDDLAVKAFEDLEEMQASFIKLSAGVTRFPDEPDYEPFNKWLKKELLKEVIV